MVWVKLTPLRKNFPFCLKMRGMKWEEIRDALESQVDTYLLRGVEADHLCWRHVAKGREGRDEGLWPHSPPVCVLQFLDLVTLRTWLMESFLLLITLALPAALRQNSLQKRTNDAGPGSSKQDQVRELCASRGVVGCLVVRTTCPKFSGEDWGDMTGRAYTCTCQSSQQKKICKVCWSLDAYILNHLIVLNGQPWEEVYTMISFGKVERWGRTAFLNIIFPICEHNITAFLLTEIRAFENSCYSVVQTRCHYFWMCRSCSS